jgi:colicin import membrane protein
MLTAGCFSPENSMVNSLRQPPGLGLPRLAALALGAAMLAGATSGCGATAPQKQTMTRLRTLNEQLEKERRERLVDQARRSAAGPTAAAAAPATPVAMPTAPGPASPTAAPLLAAGGDRLVVQGPKAGGSASDGVTAAWRVLVQELRVMRREARQDLARERTRLRRQALADARRRELQFLREQVLRLRFASPWAATSGKPSKRELAKMRAERERLARLRRGLERLERRRAPATQPVARRPSAAEQRMTKLAAQLEQQRRALEQLRATKTRPVVAPTAAPSARDQELARLRQQLAAAKAAQAAKAAAEAARARPASPKAPVAKQPTPPKRKSVDAQGELDAQSGEAEALLRAQLKGGGKAK